MALRGHLRCENCPFTTGCVPGKGPEDSPFVIVGESPGTNELRVGAPFVGESGKLLDSVLQETGLNSLGIEPYVVNALSCYPPPRAKEGTMDLMKRATEACRGRLHEQLSAHPRKVILCLGAAASWSVTGDFGIKITQARGRVLPSPLASEGVVLAVHPAFLMRQGGGLHFWKKDLACAVNLLKGERPERWTEPTWSLIQTPSQLAELTERCWDSDYVTSDLETDQLHWFPNPSPPDPNERGRILCEGITTGEGNHVWIIPEDFFYKQLPAIRRLHSKGQWAFHNSLFDVTWMRAPQHKIPVKAGIDTMLMSYARNENRGFHDLDQVAQACIGAPPHKGMLEKYFPYKGASYRYVPPEILYRYNAIDLSKQHQIYPVLRQELDADPDSARLYDNLLIPAVEELVWMKLHGVKANIERVRENEGVLQRELDHLDGEINKYSKVHIGADINVASPPQLYSLLRKMELTIPGIKSTDEDTIIKCQRRYDHPIFNLILNRRELAKAKGTYVTNLLQKKRGKKIFPGCGHIKPDGCVYPDFALHRTTTGRLAGADPNFLNQPRGPRIRGQYGARPGKVFVEVDENQAELRSLACMSGDAILLDIYTKNEISIHDVTTAAFYGSLEDMRHNQQILEKAILQLQYYGDTEDHPWKCNNCSDIVLANTRHRCPESVYKEAKMRGKAVNFGIVYGREAHSLAMEFNISVYEAQRWIDTWLGTYPDAARFIKWCRERPSHRRDLITVFGRKKRHGVVSRERLKGIQNEAANFPHQSTASDIMLEAVIQCGPILRNTHKAFCWNEVYDAVYFEIDAGNETNLAQSIELVQRTVVAIPPKYGLTRVPFLADAKVGFDWGHMKDWKGSLEDTLGKEAIEERLAA
jgi:uracil-DNA glycosylase family 4